MSKEVLPAEVRGGEGDALACVHACRGEGRGMLSRACMHAERRDESELLTRMLGQLHNLTSNLLLPAAAGHGLPECTLHALR